MASRHDALDTCMQFAQGCHLTCVSTQAKAEAKKRGTDNVKARLQFLVEDDFLAKQLSGPTRNGAINIHQRFDRHKPQVDSPLIWRAIKPPKRHPVYAPL